MNSMLRFTSRRCLKFCKCNLKRSLLTTSTPLFYRYGKLINDESKGAFYLPIKNGSVMAVIFYNKENGILDLHTTEVPEHLQNKGIGHDLAKEVLDYCLNHNLKVILTCEFLQIFYEENPIYKDIVVIEESDD